MTTSVTSIPVSRLLEESPFDLRLVLLTGQPGLGHRISSARIQKPGLALTGFTETGDPDFALVVLTHDSPAAGLAARCCCVPSVSGRRYPSTSPSSTL